MTQNIGCPLTRAFVLNAHLPSVDGAEWSDVAWARKENEERQEEVLHHVSMSEPTELVIRLRAFYLLEVLYTKALPDVAYLRTNIATLISRKDQRRPIGEMAKRTEQVDALRNMRFERSVSGINALISFLDDEAEAAETEVYTLQLHNKADPGNKSRHTASFVRWEGVLKNTKRVAELIKEHLGTAAEPATWALIGRTAAAAYQAAAPGSDENYKLAGLLLSVDQEHAISPWNQ